MPWYTKLDVLFLCLAGVGFLVWLAVTILLGLTKPADNKE
jgi:hypothetical protein